MTNVGNIAKYENKTWIALSNGTDGEVLTLAFDTNSNILYAAGNFSSVGTLGNVGSIAKWNGTEWFDLQGGIINGYPLCLFFDATTSLLFVGGNFSQVGNLTNVGSVAKWNGTWSSLPFGLTDPYGEIFSMAYNPKSK